MAVTCFQPLRLGTLVEEAEMHLVDIGSPNCKRALALLDAYLSNELLVETTALVGTHLEECLTCQKEFGTLERLKKRLQLNLLRDAVSPALRKRISGLMRQHGG